MPLSVPRSLTVLTLAMSLLAMTACRRENQSSGVKIDITAPGIDNAEIITVAQGRSAVVVHYHNGAKQVMTPDAFTNLLRDRLKSRSLIETICNVSGTTGLLWVLLGFGAQAMFTGRMLVQWIASERASRSVVPESFWWISLTGGLMLTIYFVWRRDIVAITGQSVGVFVYVRNIVLLHRARRAVAKT